jgi:hypothetical protein
VLDASEPRSLTLIDAVRDEPIPGSIPADQMVTYPRPVRGHSVPLNSSASHVDVISFRPENPARRADEHWDGSRSRQPRPRWHQSLTT